MITTILVSVFINELEVHERPERKSRLCCINFKTTSSRNSTEQKCTYLSYMLRGLTPSYLPWCGTGVGLGYSIENATR